MSFYSEYFENPATLNVNLRKINSVKKQLKLFACMSKDRMYIDIPGDSIVTSFDAEKDLTCNLINPYHDFINATLLMGFHGDAQEFDIMINYSSSSRALSCINHLFTDYSLNLNHITKKVEEVSDKYTEIGVDEIPARQKEFKTYDKDEKQNENVMILCALKDERAMRFTYKDTPERYKEGLPNVLRVINSVRFVNK